MAGSAAPERPSSGPFASPAACHDALRALLLEGLAAQVRQWWWIAEGFEDWPLSDPDILDALTAWGRPRRNQQLVCIGAAFERLRLTHPRWVQWRRNFSHVMVCRRPPVRPASGLPTLLLAQGFGVLRVLDSEAMRGFRSSDPSELARAQQEAQAFEQYSEETFSAYTLGL